MSKLLSEPLPMQFELQNVTVRFSGLPILDNISVSIASETIVLVTGPTGSGKTSLLRLLYGDLLPTRGNVLVDGQRISTLTARQLRKMRLRMGISFQDGRFVDELSVFDQILLMLLIRNVPLAQARHQTLETLVQLGISYIREKLPSECSMGEQQLVGIARAIVHEPDVLIIDEPSGFLDVETTSRVAELLVGHHKRGATIIVATHDPFFAALIPSSQRIALYDGRLVQHETLA